MWFETPTRKIFADSKRGEKNSYTVYLAREGREGCQAVFRYETAVNSARVSVSAPANGKGGTLGVSVFGEKYVPTVFAEPYFATDKVDGKEYLFPDALYPLDGEITVPANTSVPVYILFDTHGAAAGDYAAEVTLTAGGKTLDRGVITVRVWDFALPAYRSMKTEVGIFRECLANFYGLSDEKEIEEKYAKYYDFMIDNNCCPGGLPYDILDPRADRYLDDPRVNTVIVPYSGDDEIRAYYEKLSRKKEWLEKSCFYPIDEPQNPDSYRYIAESAKRLKELFPGYRMCSPFFVDPDMGNGQDGVDYVTGLMNLWCPKLFCFDDAAKFGNEMEGYDRTFAERMRERREKGEDVWWYVCCDPGEPYANLYINMEGAVSRSIFWQADLYGINGFLYWCCNFWDDVEDPWEDMRTVRKDISPVIFGDGSLVYNGEKVGVDGPCPSLRLEAVRAGIDDYEMIVMARKLGVPAEAVDGAVKLVARSVTDYTRDDYDIVKARVILGSLIEKAVS